MSILWDRCLQYLRNSVPEKQFDMWIRPLQPIEKENTLILLAPNQFVQDWVNERFVNLIQQHLALLSPQQSIKLLVMIGNKNDINSSLINQQKIDKNTGLTTRNISFLQNQSSEREHTEADYISNLNPAFRFDNFVEGKSNQLARAAAMQVAENSKAYNPLFIYGGVGLGKTHLVHAIGNQLKKINPNYKIIYLHSERFVADMVKALQTNTINEFKKYYRSVNVLMIDDIQFFANKDRTQEEFFHTFNFLLETGQQVILTSDRYPKEINGVEERLKSRFGWGLTVAVEPPELETRVAILMTKAEQSHFPLSYEIAFFIAKRIRSNVRELEGALKRVIANAHFTGKEVDIDFVRDSLKDLLILQDKLVTIENIQKTVADYYHLNIDDILSQKRNRRFVRPRQLAMALAKELTNKSLPEIAERFGGRDHTTVLHACRKIEELKKTEQMLMNDYTLLLRLLTT